MYPLNVLWYVVKCNSCNPLLFIGYLNHIISVTGPSYYFSEHYISVQCIISAYDVIRLRISPIGCTFPFIAYNKCPSNGIALLIIPQENTFYNYDLIIRRIVLWIISFQCLDIRFLTEKMCPSFIFTEKIVCIKKFNKADILAVIDYCLLHWSLDACCIFATKHK